MLSILEKLYRFDKDQAVEDIITTYQNNNFVVVNFLYFSLIVGYQVFQDMTKKPTSYSNYKKALLKGDFLFPDGIALQIFSFFAKLFRRDKTLPWSLSNLNGTDFVPYFLEQLKKRFGPQSLCIALYGAKQTSVQKACEYVKGHGYNVVYSQDGYSEFQWNKVKHTFSHYQDTVNILLVGRSTPINPIQELWTMKNYSFLKGNNFIVLNVGGLLDFWSGTQKRAPFWVRTIKMEWLYRFFSDPKRNLRKVVNSFLVFPYIFKYLLLKKK